jgi:hypothetical protein
MRGPVDQTVTMHHKDQIQEGLMSLDFYGALRPVYNIAKILTKPEQSLTLERLWNLILIGIPAEKP